MANKYLEENYAQDIALADLASKTGFSTNYFSSILFCSATGQVGRQYGWYCQICDRSDKKECVALFFAVYRRMRRAEYGKFAAKEACGPCSE